MSLTAVQTEQLSHLLSNINVKQQKVFMVSINSNFKKYYFMHFMSSK